MDIRPLTQETWPELVELFGPNGAVAGCWCTWFMQSNAELRERGSDGNRELLHGLVREGKPLGVLALADGTAMGWAAVAPRSTYRRLGRSKVTSVADESPDLWSVTCFYVKPGTRKRGTGGALLAGAVDYAAAQGARVIEAFPVDTEGGKRGAGDLYHGTVAMFLAQGFTLVERRGTSRALVRKEIR